MKFLCVSLRTFHLWGDLVFIMDDHDIFPNWIMILNSRCFSQLDGDKDSLLLDGGFSFLIAVRLIRDN